MIAHTPSTISVLKILEPTTLLSAISLDPCNAADVRFVGKPVDFVAFPGMAEGKSIEEILLIEVKTGSSKLSEREKEIRELCKRGKVRYVEYYFSADK